MTDTANYLPLTSECSSVDADLSWISLWEQQHRNTKVDAATVTDVP